MAAGTYEQIENLDEGLRRLTDEGEAHDTAADLMKTCLDGLRRLRGLSSGSIPAEFIEEVLGWAQDAAAAGGDGSASPPTQQQPQQRQGGAEEVDESPSQERAPDWHELKYLVDVVRGARLAGRDDQI